MSLNWLRRLLLPAACALAVATGLAACGGGTVESQFAPTRFVAFGDGFSDLGQNGSRYTINDGTVNIWTQWVASRYGQPLSASKSGGKSYATGNARIIAKPDAAGNSATPTVKEQVDAFLASDAIGAGDMIIVSAGAADVVSEISKFAAGAQTGDQMLANVKQAGNDMATQIRRLTDAGAQHVVVVGSYNLGKSPWGLQVPNLAAALSDASSKFNEQMLVSIVDLGAKVLYVDLALYLNLLTSAPSSYSFNDAGTQVCTTVDPGPGIGVGNGQINSALCTQFTVIPGVDPGLYVFADRVYLTPQANRTFGDYAYDRIRIRW